MEETRRRQTTFDHSGAKKLLLRAIVLSLHETPGAAALSVVLTLLQIERPSGRRRWYRAD
jgi:hypothetical protein